MKNQEIQEAMNIRSKVIVENVYTPKKSLIESAVELNEKIEALKKSIDHQKDTLVNWREEDNALQSATEYRDEMIEDVERLDMLKDSFKLLCNEMIDKI